MHQMSQRGSYVDDPFLFCQRPIDFPPLDDPFLGQVFAFSFMIGNIKKAALEEGSR